MATPASNPPLIGPVAAPGIHVMTNNLRCHVRGVPADNRDHWPTRRGVQQLLLTAEQPGLIGFQEVLADQLGDLVQILGEQYLLIGEGREGGSVGEYNPIAIDTERFDLLDHDQFWLSETPDRVGSMSWGTSLPRIAVVARLRDRVAGGEFTMVNTHLDHMSDQARGGGARLIRARLAQIEGPVVVTGDMNAPRGEGPAWQGFTDVDGPGDPFAEVWQIAQQTRSEDVETFHGYAPGVRDEGRIDWIMVRGDLRVTQVGTNTFTDQGWWPSDHYPVQAVIELG